MNFGIREWVNTLPFKDRNKHNEVARRGVREQRLLRIVRGLCPICGKNKPTQKMASCDSCRESKRVKQRAKETGCTSEIAATLMARQSGRCAICGREPRVRQLACDHDHKTKVVRGLLCGACNIGLGMFGDNAARLYLAADYLGQFSGWAAPSVLGRLAHQPKSQGAEMTKDLESAGSTDQAGGPSGLTHDDPVASPKRTSILRYDGRNPVVVMPVRFHGEALWREANMLYTLAEVQASDDPWDWDTYAHVLDGKVYRNSVVIGTESEIEDEL